MVFRAQLEQEADGRWLAEILELPGVLTYGQTRDDALAKAKALALSLIYFVGVVFVSGLIGGVVYVLSGIRKPTTEEAEDVAEGQEPIAESHA